MLVKKTIKAGIINLTRIKKEILDFEYQGYQWWIQFGIDKGILSAYRSYKGYKQKKIKYKDYPLPIQSRLIKQWFRKKDTKLCKYWIKIPASKKKGIGLWLGIKPHQNLPVNAKLCDSFLKLNHKGNYELRLIYEYDVPKLETLNLFAIDVGERTLASVCGTKGFKKMYGKEIRGIRRHYAFLRKNLGRKKLLNKIKQLGNKEKRVVNQVMHKVTNEIVREAVKSRADIIVGDPTGVRKSAMGKGFRKFRRLIASFSYYKFISYLTYKANQQGIAVTKISEYMTSKICHKCNFIGTRKTQGLFICSNCKLEYNADYNSALNMLNRSRDYKFPDGAMAYTLKPIVEI